MTTLYKIKHIHVFKSEISNDYFAFDLFNGAHIAKIYGDYIDTNTGQIYMPVCDEENNEIIGFI